MGKRAKRNRTSLSDSNWHCTRLRVHLFTQRALKTTREQAYRVEEKRKGENTAAARRVGTSYKRRYDILMHGCGDVHLPEGLSTQSIEGGEDGKDTIPTNECASLYIYIYISFPLSLFLHMLCICVSIAAAGGKMFPRRKAVFGTVQYGCGEVGEARDEDKRKRRSSN